MKNLYVILCGLFLVSTLFAAPVESDYYQIKDITIPAAIALEVGGLAFNNQGELGVVTRRGELWIIKNPTAKNPTYTRFAHGLHEPLGLAYRDGSFYCAQRGELTKLTDRNKDGKADRYETIYAWELEGNYHEYSYGPEFTPEGDMICTLNLGWIGRGVSLSKWRGWMVKITPDGQLTPIATGMRSPAGFRYNAEGDMFYTENQGDWVGSGRMTHVESGEFVGNPEGLKWTGEASSPLRLKPTDIDETKGLTLYEYAKEIETIKPPSVWFPHTLMGISTSDIAIIKEGFGPYTGQLLVGDQGHSKVMRVFQEQVNGVYQGACFPFVEGFSSGVLRLQWAPDAAELYTGMTSRGWSSTGAKSFDLQRLTWTGKTPFEMKAIRATATGLDIEFTKPIDPKTAQALKNWSITDFTYRWHSLYGSPVTDMETRKVESITLTSDRSRATLVLDQLRPGYIYEVKIDGVLDIKQQPALHTVGYYTLNQIPGGNEQLASAANENQASDTDSNINQKNQNQMPEAWEKVEVNLFLGTKPGLKYDKELLQVKAGAKVKLTFENPDDMLHNFVLIEPGAFELIATAANSLGLKGEAQEYVPDAPEVLYHTRILQPNSSEIIYFVAPNKAGDYPYVCTFPGHARVMRGILRVK